MQKMTLEHSFEPVYNEKSEILILGSFPSVKSREVNFYYGHPQNRFWKVISSVYGQKAPTGTEEKKKFLLENRIAVWDVVKRCEIVGSADSTIKSTEVNDVGVILATAQIKAIFANGKTAQQLYNRYLKNKTGSDIILLPSTSPANAAWKLDRLCSEWQNQIDKVKGDK